MLSGSLAVLKGAGSDTASGNTVDGDPTNPPSASLSHHLHFMTEEKDLETAAAPSEVVPVQGETWFDKYSSLAQQHEMRNYPS